jgi:hypothetical protein
MTAPSKNETTVFMINFPFQDFLNSRLQFATTMPATNRLIVAKKDLWGRDTLVQSDKIATPRVITNRHKKLKDLVE